MFVYDPIGIAHYVSAWSVAYRFEGSDRYGYNLEQWGIDEDIPEDAISL